MSRLPHSAAARLAAIVLAASFSGAVRALPADPARPHRCECRAHGEQHVCACAICSAAARKARAARARGEDPALPACHRAAGARAAEAEREAEARRSAGACLLPSCGRPDAPAAAAASPDPFPLPAVARLARVERAFALAARARAAPAGAAVPELPPPRSA